MIFFLKGYTKEYEELYQRYFEDEDKYDLDFAFKIEDILEWAKKRGIDITNLTSEDWYKKNNMQILINLREYEEDVLKDEYSQKFFRTMDSYVDRSRKKIWKPYELKEFQIYRRVFDIRSKIYKLNYWKDIDLQLMMKDIHEGLKEVEEEGDSIWNMLELTSMYFGTKSDIALKKLEDICREPMSIIDELLAKNVLKLYYSQDFDISHFKEYLDISKIRSTLEDLEDDERLKNIWDCILEMNPWTDWNAEHSADMQYIQWELSKINDIDNAELWLIWEIIELYFIEINSLNLELLGIIASGDTNDLECRLIEVVLLVYYKEWYDVSDFWKCVDISFLGNKKIKKAA